ncbi:RDD family protein [Rhodococcus sp. OK302]|uniref:RDD family protein n=1 Tax=Rhodococcus sp. OK302 TaxID=1882769 RepID=UPI000B943822|nr:RDD family protein [Rhodococcus sp. OK302]OYD67805.1 putative RDD family membrane protein YckC [Rhodococcus sp. OK302]
MSEQNWGSCQPPQYGQVPPNQPPQYGQMPPMSPQGYLPPQPAYPYASWISRVWAYLLDNFIVPLPGLILMIVGAVIAFSGAEVSTYETYGTYDTYESSNIDGVNGAGIAVMVVGGLAILLIELWNFVFRQGNTGQTLGKKWLGISVVRESDGVPLGPGMAFLRLLMMSILGGACFINYLWPLWDAKSQCWHDMVVRSVVIRAR